QPAQGRFIGATYGLGRDFLRRRRRGRDSRRRVWRRRLRLAASRLLVTRLPALQRQTARTSKQDGDTKRRYQRFPAHGHSLDRKNPSSGRGYTQGIKKMKEGFGRS